MDVRRRWVEARLFNLGGWVHRAAPSRATSTANGRVGQWLFGGRRRCGICATRALLISLALSISATARGQLPDDVIVEPGKRTISPVPGDFAFDVTRHTVPLREFRGGGPPKDGIPALVDPAFVSAADARELHPRDQILGVHLGGEAKAYPVRILNWHELVNDRLGGRPILVSW